MIAATQGRLLSAQVHFKVLEKVNVLGKNYNKKMKNTYLFKYLFKLLCIVHMAKATTVVLIKAYLLACFPLSAQLFVCLIVCNFRSDNKRGSRERSTGLQTNKKSIYILLYDIRYCFLS